MKKHTHICLITLTVLFSILTPKAQAAFSIRDMRNSGEGHMIYAEPTTAVIDSPNKKQPLETEDEQEEKPARHHASGFAAWLSVIAAISGGIVLSLFSVPTSLLAIALGFVAVIAGTQGLKHYKKDDMGYRVLSIIGIVMGVSTLLLGADYLIILLRFGL